MRLFAAAAIAQLEERQTEDLRVLGLIPGLRTLLARREAARWIAQCSLRTTLPCGLVDKALLCRRVRILGLRLEFEVLGFEV